MILLNFSHPLTAGQLEQFPGPKIDRVVDVKTHFDPARPFAEQALALIDSLGFSGEQWQTTPLLVNPPSLSVLACAVLAELHGRIGHFPPVLRLRPVPGSVPTQFEAAEVVDLQTIRLQAREKR